MTALPGGSTRGFLFADLRGYTAYVETHGDTAASQLLQVYRQLVRSCVARFDGAEIRTEGDGFYVVFPSASSAVHCALAILDAAAAAEDPSDGGGLHVGIGVHAGETADTPEGPVGLAVNLSARVCAVAKPGELLVTDTVRALTRTVIDVTYVDRGQRRLKGIAEPVRLFRCLPGTTRPQKRAAVLSRSRLRPTMRVSAAVIVVAVLVVATVLLVTRPLSGSPSSVPPSGSDGPAGSAGTPSASAVAQRTIRWALYPAPAGLDAADPESELFNFTTLGGATAFVEGFLVAGTDLRTGDPALWVTPEGKRWMRSDGAPSEASELGDLITPFPLRKTTVQIGSTCDVERRCHGATWLSVDPSAIEPSWIPGTVDGGPWPDDASVAGIGTGALGYVVVGARGGDPAVWLSDLGVEWRPVSVSGIPEGVALRDVTESAGQLIAIGTIAGDSMILTSSDGATWAPLATGRAFAGATLTSIGGGGDELIVVGTRADQPAVWRSTDLTTWTAESTLPTLVLAVPHAVAAGEPGYVVVASGLSGGIVMTGSASS